MSICTHTHTLFNIKEAEVLGNKDKLRLLQHRKLALVVDLDQTLVHTSMDPNIERGLPVCNNLITQSAHTHLLDLLMMT